MHRRESNRQFPSLFPHFYKQLQNRSTCRTKTATRSMQTGDTYRYRTKRGKAPIPRRQNTRLLQFQVFQLHDTQQQHPPAQTSSVFPCKAHMRACPCETLNQVRSYSKRVVSAKEDASFIIAHRTDNGDATTMIATCTVQPSNKPRLHMFPPGTLSISQSPPTAWYKRRSCRAQIYDRYAARHARKCQSSRPARSLAIFVSRPSSRHRRR